MLGGDVKVVGVDEVHDISIKHNNRLENRYIVRILLSS